MSLSSYTSPIKETDVQEIRSILEEQDFEFKQKPYAHFSAKKGKLNGLRALHSGADGVR